MTTPPMKPDVSQPARVLGLFDATSVVIGAIIGVGIFFGPARMANLTGSGPLLLIAWAVGGAIAMCGALTFAELGARRHGSGAQYQILRDAYGPLPAFLFVFCNATAIQAGAIGIIAIVCAQNLMVVVRPGTKPDPMVISALAAALIGAIAVANIIGVKWGSRIQNFTVVCKLLTLAAITVLAAALGKAEVASHMAESATRLSPVPAVMAALVPALFAFGGWQQALWISGEVREPKRNLPLAIIGGVVIVVAVYLLANWAYLKLLGVEQMAASTTLAADAVAAVMPGMGRKLVAAAVAVSAFGVLNSQLLSGPRLIFGMARDGRFFGAFGAIHPRLGTPIAAILLLAGMALVLLFAAGEKGLDRLLTGTVFVDGVFFVMTGAALLVLRRREGSEGVAFRAPMHPVFPVLFVVGELGVVIGSYLDADTRKAAYIGAAWIAAAAVLYFVRFRRATAAA